MPERLGTESDFANRFQLISRMADDLAHEIKNPLNSMVINIEVMRSRARKGDTDGILDRADVLESEVRRLNGLVDGMLKLLRPDRNSGDRFPLDPLLTEIGGLVGLQAKLARKEFALVLAGEDATAPGRRDAIRFALLNVLSAELDGVAADGGGLRVSGTTEGSGVTIRIEARGAGRETDAAPDPRIHGLEIARALIEPLGGAVAVEPEGDGGAARVILLRIADYA